MKFTTLTMAALGAANARINIGGKCPDFPIAQNFDREKLAGNWYEIARDSEFFFEMGHECTTQQFTQKEDGSLSLYFRAWMWQMLGYSGVKGEAFQCGENKNATCMIAMNGGEKLSPYNIIKVND